jgi:hypothetical protein
MLPTILFILHVEPADGGSHSRKNLAFSHLPTGVHVCERAAFADRETLSRLLDLETSAKVLRNSSPCLKAGVSLR